MMIGSIYVYSFLLGDYKIGRLPFARNRFFGENGFNQSKNEIYKNGFIFIDIVNKMIYFDKLYHKKCHFARLRIEKSLIHDTK